MVRCLTPFPWTENQELINEKMTQITVRIPIQFRLYLKFTSPDLNNFMFDIYIQLVHTDTSPLFAQHKRRNIWFDCSTLERSLKINRKSTYSFIPFSYSSWYFFNRSGFFNAAVGVLSVLNLSPLSFLLSFLMTILI